MLDPVVAVTCEALGLPDSLEDVFLRARTEELGLAHVALCADVGDGGHAGR